MSEFAINCERVNYDDQEYAPQVHWVKLLKIGGVTMLVMMLDNSKVIIYQDINYFCEKDSEKFRFKLIQSHVLMKPSHAIVDSYCPKLVQNEESLLVLHAYKPFAISVRKGVIKLNDIGASG